MVPGQRINVDLEEGKHLLIKFLSHSAELDEHGKRTVCKIGVSYTERNVWSPFVSCYCFFATSIYG
jgi:pyruvate carboxylase